MAYRDPTPVELTTPLFNAIWDCIKTWDINVPGEYEGYCGATGNHVCVILDAFYSQLPKPEDPKLRPQQGVSGDWKKSRKLYNKMKAQPSKPGGENDETEKC